MTVDKKISYSDKLKHPKWQKKRLDILNRDKFTCQLCGDTEKTLHIHHLIYKSFQSDPWEVDDESLITYCNDCHELVEIYKSAKHLTIIKVDYNNRNFGKTFINAYFHNSEINQGEMLIFRRIDGFDELIMSFTSDSLKKHLDILNSK